MEDQSCFQLVDQGVSFPPVLIKLQLFTSIGGSDGTSASSSQSSATASLAFQAIRFLNGRQELVQLTLPDTGGEITEDKTGHSTNPGSSKARDAFVDSIAGKKSLNKRISLVECCNEVYTRVQDKAYTVDYDKKRSQLQIHFKDLKGFHLVFDFSNNVKRSPVTPAFVLAFEAACSFGKLLQETQEASQHASEELKLKERELRQAERKASNLSADLTVEKQRFQRLLSSGGSSLEDATMQRAAGKGGLRRTAAMLDMPMSSASSADPDSPRKKRKAADAVLTKAGRTAQKETKTGFIDSEDDDDEGEGQNASNSDSKSPKRSRKSATPSSDRAAKASNSHKPSSSETASSSKNAGSGKKKKKAKLVEEPSLNAKRSVVSAKKNRSSGFVDTDDDATASEEGTGMA